jgi:predicted kinase
MSSAAESNSPTLIIIRGVPGSGKSYLAVALQESIGPEKVVVLDPDKIDQDDREYKEFSDSLTAESVDTKFHPYRFLRSKAYEAIAAHKIIIWNQAFMDLKGLQVTTDRLQTYASEHDTQLPILVVEVEVNTEAAKARIAERVAQGGHDVSNDAFTGFVSKYESFSEKGYRTISVNGESDVAISVLSVTKALENL